MGFVTPIMSTMGATRQKYWGQNNVNTAHGSVHYTFQCIIVRPIKFTWMKTTQPDLKSVNLSLNERLTWRRIVHSGD